MQTEINHKFFFEHSPEEVWRYLTDAELIAEWLMKTDFKPIAGYQFHFRSKPAPSIDFDGNVYCTVLEIVPYKKLSYSWKCGPGEGKITLDSIVTWTLTAKDSGTELTLKQTGFKELENYNIYAAMNEGWQMRIKLIDQHINAEKHGTTNT